MAGLCFDEFELDQTFAHEIRRTVTESDNVWFCGATCNPAQIHIDADYCSQTEFGQPLVNSIFTLGLVIGLSVQDTTLGTTVANLGMEGVRFPKPVFAGDTLRAQTTVVEMRESKSRPDAGIVSFRHEGFNQRGELICTCLRQALMWRRAAIK
ncbi:TPA: MaoC family dehydratase [Pseudomonas aeruginosa]|uniref:MaoC family dehydratase n=1 Tax=Pseudomonas plecoglossicida TaxID=70775 RepID=A0ABX4TZF1_PSEDL|nr:MULTISPECIES: MaoC family dehydratase [Pseudomonas]ASD11740.1 dehydratase [Pseudomonas aeruginosa]AZN49997.1 MaoC family dehydratase [Pseudomonas aeruginosa]EKT9494667.1 MaoC family dehydratase [Pseudomonas aeruginosa]EKU2896469.1 MaoC family dehydratase [Pseudomonas aeruginosa]EKW5415290.1 MaoC family dehydratase [Pseudomonas aeruginosa]